MAANSTAETRVCDGQIGRRQGSGQILGCARPITRTEQMSALEGSVIPRSRHDQPERFNIAEYVRLNSTDNRFASVKVAKYKSRRARHSRNE